VLTWVLSGLAAMLMGLSALVLALEPGLVDELRRQNPEIGEQGLTDRAIQVTTYVTAGVTVVWALAAVLFAVLVVRRTGWARIALLASAGGAGGVCLVASLGSLLMVLPAFGCAVTFSLLLRPDVRAWFAGALLPGVIQCSHERLQQRQPRFPVRRPSAQPEPVRSDALRRAAARPAAVGPARQPLR
jgi:hypothetical protein